MLRNPTDSPFQEPYENGCSDRDYERALHRALCEGDVCFPDPLFIISALDEVNIDKLTESLRDFYEVYPYGESDNMLLFAVIGKHFTDVISASRIHKAKIWAESHASEFSKENSHEF